MMDSTRASFPLSMGFFVAAVILLAVGAGCGDDTSDSETEESDAPTVETVTSTPSETAVNTPTQTISSPTTTEVPPYECEVLDSEQCSSGLFTDYTDPSTGTAFKLATFSLSEGAPIYAPNAGDMIISLTGEGNPLAVPTVSVGDPNGQLPAFTVMGDLVFEDATQRPVAEGEIIARVGAGVVQVFDRSIAMTFTNADGTNMPALTQAFPYLVD